MNEQPTEFTNDDAMTLDWAVLLGILRKRALLWAVAGPIAAAALLFVLLWKVPAKFTSTTSIALQQPSGGGGGALAALAGLGGGGGSAKSYTGVIRSHRFAEQAAQMVPIQSIYGLANPEQAISIIQQSVTLDDKGDGLVYLSVTLPGPPRTSPGAAAKEALIKTATRDLTGAYVKIFRRYLETSNSDRGSALLRQAKAQLDEAHANYNDSVHRLFDIATADVPTGDAVLASPPGASGSGASPRGSASISDSGNLAQLYATKGELAAEIGAKQAILQGSSRLAGESTSSLTDLPAEDPLLSEARSRVRRAEANLKDLRIGFSEDNPEVVLARARLAQAQDALRAQSRTMRQGDTSQSVEMAALQAKYSATMRQITVAERHFKVGRRLGAQTEEMRNDASLNLEVYKTAASQYAMLTMQQVAGGNLMDVIDPGVTPAAGKPGVALLLAASVAGVLFLLNLWWALEYLTRIRQVNRRRMAAREQLSREPVA